MNDILGRLFNACDPLEAASLEYYVDCSDVRGSNAFTWQFMSALAASSSYLHYLFSGHIGSGKSSELEHLRHTLETCPPASPSKRCFPILLNALDYLDQFDVTPTDILLAIVAEVAATLKERFGIELKDNYFQKRFDEIKEFLLSDVEAKDVDVPLSGAKAKIQILKRAPDARHKVRAKLLPQTTLILSEINNVFAEARLKLQQAPRPAGSPPYTDIVLIVDNLERLQRLTGHEEGERSQRELFIEKSPQLLALDAHIVYTIPLPLVRACANQLEQIYGVPPFVLPMLKVEQRGTHAPYEPGLQRLRDVLQKRAGTTPIAEIFAPETLDWLLIISGGDIRALMGFVRRICTQTDTPDIPLRTAQRALSQTVGNLGASISDTYWPKLAKLERDPTQHIDNKDPDYREMLNQVHIMEYLNGGDGDDWIAASVPWYAVNPIIRQLPKFKAALQALDNAAAPPLPE